MGDFAQVPFYFYLLVESGKKLEKKKEKKNYSSASGAFLFYLMGEFVLYV